MRDEGAAPRAAASSFVFGAVVGISSCCGSGVTSVQCHASRGGGGGRPPPPRPPLLCAAPPQPPLAAAPGYSSCHMCHVSIKHKESPVTRTQSQTTLLSSERRKLSPLALSLTSLSVDSLEASEDLFL